MNIEFTKKQYWNLLRAMYMADWMANAICSVETEQDSAIKEIRDYIFSFTKEMGFDFTLKDGSSHLDLSPEGKRSALAKAHFKARQESGKFFG